MNLPTPSLGAFNPLDTKYSTYSVILVSGWMTSDLGSFFLMNFYLLRYFPGVQEFGYLTGNSFSIFFKFYLKKNFDTKIKNNIT